MENKIYRQIKCSDRLPDNKDLTYLTNIGKVFNFDVPRSEWWLEEIELPSVEETEEVFSNMTKQLDRLMAMRFGANFILNKIKNG